MVTSMLPQRLAERKWTQKDLSKKTGIRPATIMEIYHGLCERVNLDHIDLICQALGCDVCDIFSVQYERIAKAERVARRKVQMSPRQTGKAG